MPVGRSRYEQFILFTVIMREKILVFEDVRESPVEGVFEGTFACEVEAAKSTITGISKSGSQYNDEELTLQTSLS